jgi:hypothetical protein
MSLFDWASEAASCYEIAAYDHSRSGHHRIDPDCAICHGALSQAAQLAWVQTQVALRTSPSGSVPHE